MPLSILTLISNSGLYDSESKKIIMTGSEKEMSDWKDKFESTEQAAANAEHLSRLREEYITLLTGPRTSREQAIEFLKQRLPNLFINEIAST